MKLIVTLRTMRTAILSMAFLLTLATPAPAYECSSEHPYPGNLRPAVYRPSSPEKDNSDDWVLIGAMMALTAMITYLLARPNKEDVKKAVNKAFLRREAEADVHDRLRKLSKPLQATYKGIEKELTELGLWPR